MIKQIGFIGSGNMAKAIIGGITQSKIVEPSQIMVSAKSETTIKRVEQDLNVKGTQCNKHVAEQSDVLFLAVKPNDYSTVIDEIKETIKENVIIITIAAGLTIEWIQEKFRRPSLKVVRTMPNTPSLVGEGMTAYSLSSNISAEEHSMIAKLLNGFGQSDLIEEYLMDSIPAVSGSSPAYVFMFIEALADGAVQQGMSREKAYRYAAQAVKGAAEMVLSTGKHPGELKDQVCSPGGATIKAVASLEKSGFKGTVHKAMSECYQQILELGKQN